MDYFDFCDELKNLRKEYQFESFKEEREELKKNSN
jgi:hypothetical protein